MAPRNLTRSLQTTLAHLRPPPTKGGKFGMPVPTHFKPPGKQFVQVKDRIPFWNIAPGDKVKLVKGGDDVRNKVGTVEQVWRESNRVSLKEEVFRRKKRQPSNYPGESLASTFTTADSTMFLPRSFHVANVRLQYGGLSSQNGEGKTVKRITRGPITWDRRQNKWHWTRYGLVDGENDWVELDWPKSPAQSIYDPSPLDQTKDISPAGSWEPKLSSLAIQAAKHQDAIQSKVPAGSLAPELRISPIDLGGGVHSRANRTRMFNEAKGRGSGRANKKAARVDVVTANRGGLIEVEILED